MPEKLIYLREAEDMVATAISLLERPHGKDGALMSAITMLLLSVRPTTLEGLGDDIYRWWVYDRGQFDTAMDVLTSIYGRPVIAELKSD